MEEGEQYGPWHKTSVVIFVGSAVILYLQLNYAHCRSILRFATGEHRSWVILIFVTTEADQSDW